MPLYNRIAAANYDTTWALHRNPMWANDSVPGHGGDCTNFVSQALHAGGWIMIPPSYLSLCPWYAEPFDYSRRSRTPSWASANHFGKLLRDLRSGSALLVQRAHDRRRDTARAAGVRLPISHDDCHKDSAGQYIFELSFDRFLEHIYSGCAE